MSVLFQQLVIIVPDWDFGCRHWKSVDFMLNVNLVAHFNYLFFYGLSKYTDVFLWDLFQTHRFIEQLLKFESESVMFSDHFTLKQNYFNYTDYSAFLYLSDYTNYNFVHVTGDLYTDKSFMYRLLQFENESNLFNDHFTLRHNYISHTDYSAFIYLSNYTNYNFLRIF